MAADLVRLRVAVIATPGSTAAAAAAKSATTTIPIVFSAGGDPVQTGLVASLNRPGGNVTGVSSMSGELGTKRVGLLQELVPRAAARLAALVNPNNPLAEAFVADIRAAASAIGRQIEVVTASTSRDIDTAFATLMQKRADALVVGPDPLFVSSRVQLAALAAHHAVPAIYPFREDAEAGGLMSYGPSNTDLVRQAGIYTGRVLKGEKPADMPILRAIRFELVINLKTAKALGLDRAADAARPRRRGDRMMTRREFITLLGGAAAAWPLAARAQQADIPRIGVLRVAGPGTEKFVDEFRQGLRDLGHVEGRTFVIEYRRPQDGRPEGLRELAAELIRLPVAVIVANGPQAIQVAKDATRTLPSSWGVWTMPTCMASSPTMLGRTGTSQGCPSLQER